MLGAYDNRTPPARHIHSIPRRHGARSAIVVVAVAALAAASFVAWHYITRGDVSASVTSCTETFGNEYLPGVTGTVNVPIRVPVGSVVIVNLHNNTAHYVSVVLQDADGHPVSPADGPDSVALQPHETRAVKYRGAGCPAKVRAVPIRTSATPD